MRDQIIYTHHWQFGIGHLACRVVQGIDSQKSPAHVDISITSPDIGQNKYKKILKWMFESNT